MWFLRGATRVSAHSPALSLHPGTPASLRCLCFLIPRRMPRLLSLTYRVPTRHTLTLLLLYFSTPVYKPLLFRVILNPCACLLLVRSWGQLVLVSFGPTGEPTGTEFHSSTSLLFPIQPEIPPGIFLCLPHAFTLVSCSAYFLTLKTEAICSSETSVEF
jgi:hypothetical protein